MVLIDINMPTNCENCILCNEEGGSCFLVSINPKRKPENGRPKECPIIEEVKKKQ